MENTKNIYQRMSDATDEIGIVAKNLFVGVGQSAYKAVGEADVLSAVKPIERKHGIYSYPCARKIVDTNVLTSRQSGYDKNGKEFSTEKNQLFMRIETTYRFVNMDNPAEFIDITTYGDGVDSQDKACGKAMTYADKYALLKAYKIITGDDPDQFKSLELAKEPTATKKQLEILSKAYTGDNLKKLLDANKINDITELPFNKAKELISKLANRG